MQTSRTPGEHGGHDMQTSRTAWQPWCAGQQNTRTPGWCGKPRVQTSRIQDSMAVITCRPARLQDGVAAKVCRPAGHHRSHGVQSSRTAEHQNTMAWSPAGLHVMAAMLS